MRNHEGGISLAVEEMCESLARWADNGVSCTAYLDTGGRVTSRSWQFDERDNGALVLRIEEPKYGVFEIDPARVIAVGGAVPDDAGQVLHEFTPFPGQTVWSQSVDLDDEEEKDPGLELLTTGKGGQR